MKAGFQKIENRNLAYKWLKTVVKLQHKPADGIHLVKTQKRNARL